MNGPLLFTMTIGIYKIELEENHKIFNKKDAQNELYKITDNEKRILKMHNSPNFRALESYKTSKKV